MNSELMIQSFFSCIENQKINSKYIIVEFLKETEADVKLLPKEEIPEILKKEILGFTFGENPRPIMKG